MIGFAKRLLEALNTDHPDGTRIAVGTPLDLTAPPPAAWTNPSERDKP